MSYFDIFVWFGIFFPTLPFDSFHQYIVGILILEYKWQDKCDFLWRAIILVSKIYLLLSKTIIWCRSAKKTDTVKQTQKNHVGYYFQVLPYIWIWRLENGVKRFNWKNHECNWEKNWEPKVQDVMPFRCHRGKAAQLPSTWRVVSPSV